MYFKGRYTKNTKKVQKKYKYNSYNMMVEKDTRILAQKRKW